MGHTLLRVLELFLLNTLLYVHAGVSNWASLTLEPSWSQIFSGETITLRCKIQGGGGTGWTYVWTSDSLNTPPTNSEYRISSATESHSGKYWCMGTRDSVDTVWSDPIRLTVSPEKPEARLTADKFIIPIGGSVRLTCSVEGSAGWKYEWFKRTSYFSEPRPIRDSVAGNAIHVKEGGLYHCRGGRGDPLFYTENSNEVTIQKTVSNKASLTLEPNWSQIFRDEAITLRCQIQGGGGTDWTYEWRLDRSYIPSTNNEYRIRATNSGEYKCMGRRDSYSLTAWSNIIKLTVSSNRPKAELSAVDRDIPVGGSVTLTCSVKTSSSGWKYFWYRGEKTSEPLTTQDVSLSTGQFRVSQEGVYWCRGGRGEPVYYTEYSDSVSINKNLLNKPAVTLQPNWSEIFSGETITLRCEIKNGGDTEWEYEWKPASSEKPLKQNEVSIRSASSSHSGNYRCKGRMKNNQSTEWSDPIKLTVSGTPLPVLTVSPSWLNDGDSVTLNCKVEHPSAGWSFYWNKTVPKLPEYGYSSEQLPGSINGTEQDSYIVHGQTGTAGYVCRAGRGDPVYYTQYSKPQFVLSGDLHSSASLTVSPDRVQHFTYQTVSLNCEGNSTKWRVRGLGENSYQSSCSSWGTMTGSTCNIDSYSQRDGVFWCESGSGEFSNAVNISIQNRDIILVSPVRPVTEGDPVSLSCKLRTGIFVSDVFFYRNDELIQNDTRQELNISAVSKSDEGFYKCQHSGEESSQSWMSVQAVSRPEGSSVPVGLIVGLVCGIVLLLLLLFLLYRCRPSKYLHFIRQSQSEGTNQGFDMVNQNEAQGGAVVYESIKGPEDTETVAGGSQDVTYSLIELKNIKKKGTRHEPEESSVYSDVKTRTADDNLMYAQVNHHNKGNAKKTKGTPRRAATDEAVYSEVKPGRSLGL